MHMPKVSTNFSLHSPCRLTWAKTFCCLSIFCISKDISTSWISQLFDQNLFHASIIRRFVPWYKASKRCINSLPNNKILEGSNLKAFADNKIKLDKMLIVVFEGIENIVGKGENASLPGFSPFPTIFSKGLLLGDA